MYQALYRKYRPKRFSDVAGQEHITETLRGQIATGRLTHAYLFIGTRGTGKTTCAKILSRAVNCSSPVDGNPCNECPSCKGIEDGTILDVLEIDAASNNGVDNIRDLRDEAIYSPSAAAKRVYILDEAHMLTSGAVNALLKILEEPPAHVIFILATTELHKVPATIQSRCQKFSFRRLPPPEIATRLCEIAASEGLTLMPEAAEKLAAMADGSMRDGISLLDQCVTDKTIDIKYIQDTLGLASEQELLRLVRSIADCDAIAALEILDRLYKDGREMAALLGELSGILRDLLVARLAPDSSLISSGIARSELSAMSELLSTERLFYCIEVAKTALLSANRTGISKLVLEMCLIRMIDERLSDDPAALIQRISRLEEGAPASAASTKHSAPPVPSPPPAARPTETISSEPQDSQAHDTTVHENRAEAPAPVEPPSSPEAEAPAPAPTPAPSANPDDILPGILEHIDDGGLRVILKDSSKAWASQVEGVLVVKMTDEFNANIVRTQFSDTLREAASKTIGREMPVRIETVQSDSNADKQSKLDSLMAFGDIVRVEGDS